MRDLVDLVTINDSILLLGAVIWAAVEKSPGFTPEGLISEIRRNSNYPAAEWRALMTSQPLDPKDVTARLEEYKTHAGQRREQWPISAEIMAAMFERYKKPPSP